MNVDAKIRLISSERRMNCVFRSILHYYPESLRIRNFNLYLNGSNIGAIYFDYWASIKLGRSSASYPTFKLNGTPAVSGVIPGLLVVGCPAILEYNILPAYNSTLQNGSPVYVLQRNGTRTGE
jgi:hypothetical protein